MTPAEQVQEQLASMKALLDTATPGLPGLLRTIHQQLKKDPEIVTILSDEECNILVEGLKEHTKIELSCTQAAKKGKSLKNTKLADLM